MKKLLRWSIGISLCLFGALLVFWLAKDAVLKSLAVRRIRKETGLEAKFGAFHLGFGSARLTVKDFRLLNRPEFGGATLLHMPELLVVLDVKQAAAGRLHFKELRFNLAEMNLVRKSDGLLNVQSLAMPTTALPNAPPSPVPAPLARSTPPSLATSAPAPAASTPTAILTGAPHTAVGTAPPPTTPAPRPVPNGPSQPQRKSYEFAGIDRLAITLGKVTYSDLRQPQNRTEIDFGIENETATNLRTTEDLNHWLATLVVRVALQEYLNDPGKSRAMLRELIVRGLRGQ